MPAARVMNGREVTIEGARAHAVYTVGDTIIVKDSTLRDLFAGGHGIEIQGTIGDDAIVAVCPVCPWGSVHLLRGPTGRIGDEACLMASTLEIQATIAVGSHSVCQADRDIGHGR